MIELAAQLLSRFGAACQPKMGGLLPTWYKYLEGETVAGRCGVVANFPDDTGKVLAAIAEILLRVAGLVAVGYIIYGGFQFILSQGEPDKAKDARRIIINSLVGLVITLMATVIVSFVARSII